MEELSAALERYSNRKGRDKPRCSVRHRRSVAYAASVRTACEAILKDILRPSDLRPLFVPSPDVVDLIILVQGALQRLGDLAWYIGPLMRWLADLLRSEAAENGWSIHQVFADIMVPALVHMSKKKSKTFGVIFSATKYLFRKEEWPDTDEQRRLKLGRVISAELMEGSSIFIGLWLLVHLQLGSVYDNPAVLDSIIDKIEPLRLYCSLAPKDVCSHAVREVIAMGERGTRKERRERFATAADLIVRCKLDKTEFPQVARFKFICWLCYICHRVPAHLIQDYVKADPEFLTIAVEQLFRAGDAQKAAEVYAMNKSSPIAFNLSEPTKNGVLEALTQMTPKVDNFAPRDENALHLPLAHSAVVWVDTAEGLVEAEKVLREEAVVGVDLEWSSFGDWMQHSLALLQVATAQTVFLVDLACESIARHIGSLMQTLFAFESPLVLGFAFQNDIRELRRSPWADSCGRFRGLCDLQLLASKDTQANKKQAKFYQEGLSSLVARSLSKPLCKAEQRSYWHGRPLRASQCHYAALDAYVLLQVAAALTDMPLSDTAGLASHLRDSRACNLQDEGPLKAQQAAA
eukprot:TRINITY_DN31688_c0_g1_i1.p1 TRINITY_DN31688_c0_g1~~TRINITY_DN31688_c0_g1_i1.p1  ORF type:complete len:576 (-),score=61.22 TRINITY_DN31688_c0_g1_i1:170-1897(-)